MILCEHGAGITDLVDVMWWENPRRKRFKKYTENGIEKWYRLDGKNRVPVKRPPLDGKELYDRLITMKRRYHIRFEFCEKSKTGKRIVALLGGDVSG